jgi:hypothetical protein
MDAMYSSTVGIFGLDCSGPSRIVRNRRCEKFSQVESVLPGYPVIRVRGIGWSPFSRVKMQLTGSWSHVQRPGRPLSADRPGRPTGLACVAEAVVRSVPHVPP